MNCYQKLPTNRDILLRAGAMVMQFENGDIRYIRVGRHEILRRIYVAVRDQNWGTVPARITIHDLAVQPDAFKIRFRAEHDQGDIHFVRDGEIIGGADNTLRFTILITSAIRNRRLICMDLRGIARCTCWTSIQSRRQRVIPKHFAPPQASTK